MAAGNPLIVQLILLLLTVACFPSCDSATNYWAGVGKWDITGPPVGVPLMGYANPSLVGEGIHTRLFSRAFIFEGSSDSGRVVFVSIDACFVSGAVKREVIKKLKALYGSLYTEKNVIMSASHTHSGPGGYSQFLLYDVTMLGFNRQVFETQVHGVVQSIKRAHESARPANLYVNTGQLLDANINRSPSAYRNNPAAERARYTHDVVKTMTVLKVVDSKGVGIGMISWFPVHCTSMNNTNHLVSSDNKGYASLMFERRMNGRGRPGQDSFVASFAQGSLGDVSPNIRGPHCLDSGDTCGTEANTCNGKSSQCASLGPGADMFASTEIIGGRQFRKALELYEAASTLLQGPVDFRHSFVDMPREKVTLTNGTQNIPYIISMEPSSAMILPTRNVCKLGVVEEFHFSFLPVDSFFSLQYVSNTSSKAFIENQLQGLQAGFSVNVYTTWTFKTTRPSTARPSTARPSTARPSTDRPSTDRPSTDRPSTTRPSTDRPSTDRPSTAIPSTTRPSTDRPSTDRPSTTRPSTARPSTARPSTIRPSTDRPSTDRPSTDRPSTDRPSTTRPSTTRPSTTRPSTAIHSTTRPSTTRPSTARPSTARPSTAISSICNNSLLYHFKVFLMGTIKHKLVC